MNIPNYDPSIEPSDLDMIKDYMSWPLYPFLPVKKRKKDGGFPTLGVIVADNRPLVYKQSVDEVIKLDRALTDDDVQARYSSFEELIADEWVID